MTARVIPVPRFIIRGPLPKTAEAGSSPLSSSSSSTRPPPVSPLETSTARLPRPLIESSLRLEEARDAPGPRPPPFHGIARCPSQLFTSHRAPQLGQREGRGLVRYLSGSTEISDRRIRGEQKHSAPAPVQRWPPITAPTHASTRWAATADHWRRAAELQGGSRREQLASHAPPRSHAPGHHSCIDSGANLSSPLLSQPGQLQPNPRPHKQASSRRAGRQPTDL
ncbi:hypothetical protein QBC39DRAFT_25936 [Podospora conica]|nr:hypothetical protein QBC39DRAFT_25936 [Schizothecium conicum]